MTSDPMVTAEWLKSNIDAPDLRVVDATWFAPFLSGPKTGRQAYNSEHIPGAVYFDIDEITDSDSVFPHTFPDAVKFSSRVRKLGIGDGNRIVVYDQNNYAAAARVWWMLRVMGHKDVTVLDGGFNAWTASGGDIEDLPPVAVERHFTPRVQKNLIKSVHEMEDISANASMTILDARSPGRFSGDAPEPRADLESGHMPNSKNVPAGTLLNNDGTLKSAKDLAPMFDDPSAPTVTSCGSGVTAAIIALALARLGNYDVAVFDGSWSEWASDPARPNAKGASA